MLFSGGVNELSRLEAMLKMGHYLTNLTKRRRISPSAIPGKDEQISESALLEMVIVLLYEKKTNRGKCVGTFCRS